MIDSSLTVKEVSELLSVHPNTVRTMAEDGRIAAFKTKGENGHWRFRKVDVDAFLDSKNEEVPGGKFENIHFLLNEIPAGLLEGNEDMGAIWNYIHRYYGIRSVFGSIAVHSDKESYYNLVRGKSFIWMGEGAANAMEGIKEQSDNRAKYIASNLKYAFGIVSFKNIFQEIVRSVVPLIVISSKDGESWVVDGTIQQSYPQLPQGLAVMELNDANEFYTELILYDDNKRFAEDYSDPLITKRILESRELSID